MSDAKFAPTFKACDEKRGLDWSVLVTWPDQRQQYLDGFQSHDEMLVWINDKSLAWFEAQQPHACPSGPRRHDHIWSRFEMPSERPRALAAGLRDVAAIDQMISVVDAHQDFMKEDRKARGEAFKDEQGPA